MLRPHGHFDIEVLRQVLEDLEHGGHLAFGEKVDLEVEVRALVALLGQAVLTGQYEEGQKDGPSETAVVSRGNGKGSKTAACSHSRIASRFSRRARDSGASETASPSATSWCRVSRTLLSHAKVVPRWVDNAAWRSFQARAAAAPIFFRCPGTFSPGALP